MTDRTLKIRKRSIGDASPKAKRAPRSPKPLLAQERDSPPAQLQNVANPKKVEDQICSGALERTEAAELMVAELSAQLVLAGAEKAFLADRNREIDILRANFIAFVETSANHLANVDFIIYCYRTLLRREPDPNGLFGYLNDLERGISRYTIIAMVINSAEYQSISSEQFERHKQKEHSDLP